MESPVNELGESERESALVCPLYQHIVTSHILQQKLFNITYLYYKFYASYEIYLYTKSHRIIKDISLQSVICKLQENWVI